MSGCSWMSVVKAYGVRLRVSYIELARALGRMSASDFLARFGFELSRALADMPGRREDNLLQLFQLHRRIPGFAGNGCLGGGISTALRPGLPKGRFPNTAWCGSPLVLTKNLGRLIRLEPKSPSLLVKFTTRWRVLARCSTAKRLVLALDHDNQYVVIEGLDPFSGEQMFRLFELLAGLRENDVAGEAAG